MKTVIYSYPQSSFLSVEKDMNLIVNMIMQNNSLKKLLHYTSRDCMTRPPLNEDETLDLFGKNIKVVPKLYVDADTLNYIFIGFDNFVPNPTNPEFRDNVIEFKVLCHFDQWQLKDFQLRPYRIAAEIDTMFNNKHLTGIGTLEFLGASYFVTAEEFGGFSLQYRAVHGGEDKKGMPNPNNERQFIENYNQMFNDN